MRNEVGISGKGCGTLPRRDTAGTHRHHRGSAELHCWARGFCQLNHLQRHHFGHRAALQIYEALDPSEMGGGRTRRSGMMSLTPA